VRDGAHINCNEENDSHMTRRKLEIQYLYEMHLDYD